MNKNKKNAKIREYMFNDYFSPDKEFENTADTMKKLELLVDNGLGFKIVCKTDVEMKLLSHYKVCSKFLLKYDKSLKKYKRPPMAEEIGVKTKTSDINPKLYELADFSLDVGTYYVILNEKKYMYAVMIVEKDINDADYMYASAMYIIGDDCTEWREKYYKLYNSYEKLAKERKRQTIRTSDGEYKFINFKSFDKLIFKDKDKIINYIDNWVKNIPKYHSYGITPKLSILLYGDPGTGKSSFCQAVADHLGINMIDQLLPSYFIETTVQGKKNEISHHKSESITAIDEIDCICSSREKTNDKENNKILSVLLSFLDNPTTFLYKASNGISYPVSVVIATTNYYDRLDDAVKRHGRFDLKIHMKNFNIKEAEEMCDIYGLNLRDIYKGKLNKETEISPAYLQALCMENIDMSLKDVEK